MKRHLKPEHSIRIPLEFLKKIDRVSMEDIRMTELLSFRYKNVHTGKKCHKGRLWSANRQSLLLWAYEDYSKYHLRSS